MESMDGWKEEGGRGKGGKRSLIKGGMSWSTCHFYTVHGTAVRDSQILPRSAKLTRVCANDYSYY